MAASGGSPVAEDAFDLNLGMAGSVASSAVGGGATAVAPQDQKMEFDLNLGEIASEESAASAVKGRPERNSEALSENLGFAGLTAVATGNVASARTHEGDMAGDKARLNSWEIDPAISDFGNIDFGLDDSDLLAGTDVVGTKLDLARAYLDMGDNDSARDILKEVIAEGNEQQRQEAKGLVEKIA
jgi:pilus assembly protein FimV